MLFLLDSQEDTINHKDTDTELFGGITVPGATINYNKLKELVNLKNTNGSESDINNILKNYHKKVIKFYSLKNLKLYIYSFLIPNIKRSYIYTFCILVFNNTLSLQLNCYLIYE